MTALPEYARPLTSAEYAALPEDIDARFELQEGNRVMSPSPVPRHQLGHFRLASQLQAQLPGHLIIQEVDIDLELVPPDQPGTVRVPDVVVVSREAFRRVDEHGGLLRASDVDLAVEILSRGSVRTDSRIKHEEYADAGIGHYWMIDLLDGPSLIACHLAGEFGYRDDEPVRGAFSTEAPFPLRIDLDALIA